jgi:hypothetical protein
MMILESNTPFQKAIDAVKTLEIDDREELFELLKMRLAEYRRDEIAANAREAVNAGLIP